MPCRPCREQSHQPGPPPCSCSRTISMSPFRKASSSGLSAALSNSAFAKTVETDIVAKLSVVSQENYNSVGVVHLEQDLVFMDVLVSGESRCRSTAESGLDTCLKSRRLVVSAFIRSLASFRP